MEEVQGELRESAKVDRGLRELGELRTAGGLWLLGGVTIVVIRISLFAFPETTDWWTDRDNWIL
ncbi:MAG: hypothetical protein OEV40_21070 [Acidimicrobiia bacterium]|nr:hypothetical protein [Acidimicrobiia bacterium]